MNFELRVHLDRLYAANDKLKELNTGMADSVRVAIAKATWRITMAHAEIEEALKAQDILAPMHPADWEKINYPNNI
jgi:hypothetical protein